MMVCLLLLIHSSLPIVNAADIQTIESEALDKSDDTNDEQIITDTYANTADGIIAEIGRLRAKQLFEVNNETDTAILESTLSAEITALENQLMTLGVKILSAEEVALIQAESQQSENQPYIFTPAYTENVRWYSREEYHVYEGQVYFVNHLYAQGLNSKSMLAETEMNLKLKTTKNHIIDDAKKECSG